VVNLEYHKGELCAYNSVLCQEGFCSECIIYLERDSQVKPRFTKNKDRIQNKGASRITINGRDRKIHHISQPQR